jgi:NAD(P)-dependent dehydrogenase (short-subunit alcohol dehydrogenase family)
MSYRPLKGQTALVTGASSGIGLGVTRALGAAGADVVVNYVSAPEAAERLAEEIRKGQSRPRHPGRRLARGSGAGDVRPDARGHASCHA